MQSLFWFSFAMAMCSAVIAAPSYNPTTGHLNLPELLVGEQTYTNVEVLFDANNRYQLLAATPPVSLLKSDNGRTIAVAMDQSIEVKLGACPTCGYRWKFVNNLALLPSKNQTKDNYTNESLTIVEHQEDKYVPYNSDPAPGFTGGSGNEIWKFKATKAGQGFLRLDYYGPGATEPAESFQVTLTIK